MALASTAPAPAIAANCVTSRTVCSSGCDDTTIMGAVNALAPSLANDTCVVIRDTMTYSEQVEVRGFTNNDFRLTIMADPSFISSAPIVNPPASSTAAFWIQNASVTLHHISIVSTNPVSYGILASSGLAAISSVSVQDPGGLINFHAISLTGSTSTLTGSSVTVSASHALYLKGASYFIGLSTFTNTSTADFESLFMEIVSGSTVTGSFFFHSNRNPVWIERSHWNLIERSTFTSTSSDATFGFFINSQDNTLLDSHVNNNSGSSAIHINAGPGNRIVATRLIGTYLLDGGSRIGLLRSTVTVQSGYTAIIHASGVSDAMISESILEGGRGIGFSAGALRPTIERSTVTTTGADPPIVLAGVSSATITDCYIQGSTAIVIGGSTGTVIHSSVLIATGTAASAVAVSTSLNLTLTASTIRGGPRGAALFLDRANAGTLLISSNTIRSGGYGLWIATQSASASLSLTSMSFAGGLASGATGVYFTAGAIVSTFTAFAFDDAAIAVNVSGRHLNSAARINMVDWSGARGGPSWENDPSDLIAWSGALPAGCSAAVDVGKSGFPFASIAGAIGSLGASLSGDTCVVIRDTMTYSEQVDARGFANNGYRLKIMGDPTFISSAPIVNPPAASTAAFWIQNASVTIQNIVIYTTNTVNYGVLSSSGHLSVSNVNVDSNGSISSSAFRLEGSTASVVGSSVTVSAAHGFSLTGSSYFISGATVTNTSSGDFESLNMTFVFASTITGSMFLHSGRSAGHAANSAGLLIERSTFSAASGTECALGFANNTRDNTIVDSYLGHAGSACGLNFNSVSRNRLLGSKVSSYVNVFGGTANQIRRSTVTANAGSFSLRISGAADTLVSESIFEGGTGALLQLGAVRTTIDRSTITTTADVPPLNLIGASTTTISDCYVQGSTAAMIAGSTGTVIASSILIATGTTASAVWMSTGVNVSVTSSTLRGGSLGAGLYVDRDNTGALLVSSSTIIGGRFGMVIATQTAAASLSVSSLTLAGPLASGATGIHFTGGSFVSTFTKVAFNDPSIGVNVNGLPLAAASRLTMSDYSGARGGPSFENDPSGVVAWVLSVSTPPSSPVVSRVHITSITVTFGGVGADFYTVQASTAADFTGSISSAGASTAVPLTPEGLTPNTTYYLRGGAVWGAATDYASVSPASTATLAAAPSPLAFSGITATAFTLNWNTANPSGTRFIVTVSTDIGFGVFTASRSLTALNETFPGLTPDATYFARVVAINHGGTPSEPALGAVVMKTGVVTVSANRLASFWYSNGSTVFNAQGATNFRYKLSQNPAETITGADPLFNGAALDLSVPEGLYYFHVLGVGGAGDGQAARYGPVQIDTSAPTAPAITAQASAADATVINGGTTNSDTPRFSWPEPASASPVLGYSFSLSANSSIDPPPTVNTTIRIIDQVLSAPGVYYAKIRALDTAGNWGAPSAAVSFTYTLIPTASSVAIKKNYFNPVRGECTLFTVRAAQTGRQKIELFTLLGQKVATVVDQSLPSGTYNYSWCGRTAGGELVAAGSYLLKIEAPQHKKELYVIVAK